MSAEQQTLTKMLASLNELLGRVKSEHSSLDESVKALLEETGAGHPDIAKITEKLKDIGGKQARLREALDLIKTSKT